MWCETNNGLYLQLYRRYVSLHPANAIHWRFFDNYQNGKHSMQYISVNSFGKMLSVIAAYLGLPHPEMYPGHYFWRSSATMLVDSWAYIILKGIGWKTTSVAELLTTSLQIKNCAKHPSAVSSSLTTCTGLSSSQKPTNVASTKWLVNHDAIEKNLLTSIEKWN